MADLDRRLAQIAQRQHSLIRTADVVLAGGTEDTARRRVNGGRWVRVMPGVYRLAGVPWTYEARVLAAVFCAGPGAVASHLCAARLWGIGFPSASPEISIPRGRHHRPSDVRVHQSTDLDRCTVRSINGIPATDPARTLLDLGRYIGPAALYRAVERARKQQLVTWSDLVRCLVVHARRGRHGTRRLRSVIVRGMPIEEVTDTDSELMAVTVIRDSELPEPTLHHRVRYDDGEILAEVDLAFVPLRLAVEIDGTVHLDPVVRDKDERRDHRLRRLGWTVRRVWWEIPVREPERFLRMVRGFIAEARADTARS